MDFILAISLPLRLLILFVAGTLVGSLVNWAVYRLAWNPRAIGPWSAPLPAAPPRKLSDRWPVFGWLGLRRESALHGRRFWIRPLVVEVLTGAALVALYLWETRDAARLWAFPGTPLPPIDFLTDNLRLAEHLRFLSHAILLCLMLAASLIDLDEKTIPDTITVPGTVIGLVLAAAYPWSLLPAAHFALDGGTLVEFLTLASPNLWPAELAGSMGLKLALGCWSLWCFALLPRCWNTRRGWAIALRVFWRRLFAEWLTYVLAVLWLAGSVAIVLASGRLNAAHWSALVTSLVGMAAGGGVIWCVRIIGRTVLHKEAMGFGDVTLMAMIGAVLGWQACLMIFFVAPFFGLIFAVGNWVLHREHEIPYGPFLCLGALAVIVRWPDFWERTFDVFSLGWLVPAMLAVCFVLMALMLGVYEVIRRRIVRE